MKSREQIGRSSRAKGAAGERELCKWLDENFELESKAERNLDQVRSGGIDIITSLPVVFEVKRCESLDLTKWWIQAKAAAEIVSKVPVVAFRQNRKKWEFLIGADQIGLNRGYLRLNEQTFLLWMKEIVVPSQKT